MLKMKILTNKEGVKGKDCMMNTDDHQKTYSNPECALIDGTGDSRHRGSSIGASGTLLHLNDLIVIPSGMGVVWDGCRQC